VFGKALMYLTEKLQFKLVCQSMVGVLIFRLWITSGLHTFKIIYFSSDLKILDSEVIKEIDVVKNSQT
jgi:hypothetical protein